jgi:hypothetical protein
MGALQPVTRVDGGITPVPEPDAGTPMQYTGEACMRGESAMCTCGSGTQGTKNCMFDANSPTMGTFSACGMCADPSDPDPGDVMGPDAGAGADAGGGGSGTNCSDGEQNGQETDVDCGGTECPSCLIGKKCGATSDCSAGECVSGICELPSAPTGGSSCQPACTQICFPVGILPCCNALGRCGCTWAPGAYCF